MNVIRCFNFYSPKITFALISVLEISQSWRKPDSDPVFESKIHLQLLVNLSVQLWYCIRRLFTAKSAPPVSDFSFCKRCSFFLVLVHKNNTDADLLWMSFRHLLSCAKSITDVSVYVTLMRWRGRGAGWQYGIQVCRNAGNLVLSCLNYSQFSSIRDLRILRSHSICRLKLIGEVCGWRGGTGGNPPPRTPEHLQFVLLAILVITSPHKILF